MGKNTKPMLTALMDSDKLQRLRDFASEKDVSMGWLINRLVDRLLTGDVDVMGESTPMTLTREALEQQYIGMTREDVEEMIKTSIDNESIREAMERAFAERLETRIAPIGVSIEELRGELSEVSEFARNLQSEIDRVKKALGDRAETQDTIAQSQPPVAIASPQTLTESKVDTMTWLEFHQMVGLEAPSKKEKTRANADIALAKAIETGIEGWRFDSTNKNFRQTTPNQP